MVEPQIQARAFSREEGSPGSAHGITVASAALYLAWALCVRCSPMLFAGATSTRPSYLFLVALAAGVAIVSTAGGVAHAHGHRPPSTSTLWFWSCLAGCLATLACLTPWCAGLPTTAAALGVGLPVGVSYGLALACALRLCRSRGAESCIQTLVVALAFALALALALCWAVPVRLLACAGLLPMGSWLVMRRDFGADGEQPDPDSDQPAIPRGRLRALMACLGFFASFVVGMHPKTAHLPWLVENVAYLGSMSSRSIAYLVVYGLLLALFARVLRRRKPGSGLLLLVALVLVYAVMFFTLPFMKDIDIPSCLNNALSLFFLTLAVPMLAALGRQDRWNGMLCLGLGALGAAVAAAIFMGPLFDVLPHQDEVFVAVPFAVNLAVLTLGVTLGPWLRAVFFGSADALLASAPRTCSEDECRGFCASWGLTNREAQVLELVIQGRNEPYIGEALCISRATVKTHVNHIYKKAGVGSRQELLDLVYGSARG